MPRPAGFIIDVPVTLSVAVRGDGLTLKQAKRIARDVAAHLNDFDANGFNERNRNEMPAGVEVTEATLDSSTEESCEELETLEAEE